MASDLSAITLKRTALPLRATYAGLAVLGALLPLSQFLPWLVEHGLAFPLLIQQAFAWWDVVMSALALLVFMVSEGRRLGMQRLWLPVAGLCLVGVSLALPLFLLMRERDMAHGVR